MGIIKNAYFAPASEVLTERSGYSMSKTTLFVALMRANNIPAKQHYADLTAHTTRQYINFGTLFIDHSYAEVKLNGKWLKIDSYIIDDALYKQAKKKLNSRKRVIGYGINKRGKNYWSGNSDSMQMYHVKKALPNPISQLYHGVHPDNTHFYNSAKQPWNKQGFIKKLLYKKMRTGANERIDKFRKTGEIKEVIK